MYDVLYLDRRRSCRVVASNVERDNAARIARDEARRRGSGRMFAGGSPVVPGHAVLVVRSGERVA